MSRIWDQQVEMMMADGPMAVDVEVPILGEAVGPPLGVDPQGLAHFLKMDPERRVIATLDDETLDRIAVRVADLLYARNRSGER